MILNSVTSATDSIFYALKTFVLADFFDILFTAFIIYHLIKLVRETRATQLVKGILIFLVTYVISDWLNFKMLHFFLNKFLEYAVLMVLIVFQPELRRALEQLGRSKIGKRFSSYTSSFVGEDTTQRQTFVNFINTLVDSVADLSRNKTGALIVIERQTKLGEIVSTGTIINAVPTVLLFNNIFYDKAPLHDGALILRDCKVFSVGCILPLTKNQQLSLDLGTRHRAALGVSEISDAIAIVVSEETGSISLAIDGVLTRDYTKEHLKNKLDDIFLLEDEHESNVYRHIKDLISGKRTK